MPHFHKSIVDYTHHAPYINTAKVCHQMPRWLLLEYVRCPLLYLDVLHTKKETEPFNDIHKEQVCRVRSS